MGKKLHLYSGLTDYVGGHDMIEVNGRTVGECLHELIGQYPRLKNVLFDKNGGLQSHVFASINLKSAYPEKLDTPLEEGDELHIALIIAGG
jgi:molybdopterin converting factor small subunit